MGYQDDFLGKDANRVPLVPIINQNRYQLVERIDHDGEVIIDYNNYSVIMDKERKFPILTASNVLGDAFIKVDRKGSWKKDDRILKEFQWGTELYDAEKSDFDKGHMTKREDVQWGNDKDEALEAAKSTFYYTNAVPQHRRLNRAVWRSIEHYILKSETFKHQLKVTVLTGPVLDTDDPEFVTEVKNERVQLPVLFWKIVYYLNDDAELHRTAFLVSQKELLEEKGIVKRTRVVRSFRDDRGEAYFLRFKKAATYQVRVDLIENLTGLKFKEATEMYVDDRPQRLIEKEVNVRGFGNEVNDENLVNEIIIRNLVI